MSKNILVVGGSSGLGRALAGCYHAQGHKVTITGRKDPHDPRLAFHAFAITAQNDTLATQLDALLAATGPIDMLIYAAGYYQEGTLDQLSDAEILTMLNVGLTAPTLLIQRLKKTARQPCDIVLITSSSQYTPREKEPVYTAVKAGLGMLGASLALDRGIGKVLVAAPSGMATPFWDAQKAVHDFLSPEWVAQEIVTLFNAPFTYRYAKILRGPAYVEIVEERV